MSCDLVYLSLEATNMGGACIPYELTGIERADVRIDAYWALRKQQRQENTRTEQQHWATRSRILTPRQITALALFITGATYEHIAEKMGVTTERARQLLRRVFRKLRHEWTDHAEAARNKQYEEFEEEDKEIERLKKEACSNRLYNISPPDNIYTLPYWWISEQEHWFSIKMKRLHLYVL